MPTYEYACKSCGEHLEIVQSFRDDPLTECPPCGGELRKVFHSIGIAFKGSGFYKNDSRPKAGKDNGSKESGSKESGSKDSSAKETGSSSKDAGSSAKPAAPTPSSSSGTSKTGSAAAS